MMNRSRILICAVGMMAAFLPRSTWATQTAGAPLYQWTISASSADPYVNVGAPAGGIVELSLWHVSSGAGPLNFADFSLVPTPGMTVLALTSLAGYEVSFESGNVRVTGAGCPWGYAPAARLLVLDIGGSLCIGSTPDGVNCFNPCGQSGVLYRNSYVGYTSEGGPPCRFDNWVELCNSAPTSSDRGVETQTWGRVKRGYR